MQDARDMMTLVRVVMYSKEVPVSIAYQPCIKVGAYT
jgi:hypothetical protein